MTSLVEVSEAQANKAETVNENFEAVSPSGLFGIRRYASGGLIFAYYGGVLLVGSTPTIIANDTLTLNDDVINYIEASSSGVVSISTGSPTGFTSGKIPLYKITCASGSMTEIIDYRMTQYATLP